MRTREERLRVSIEHKWAHNTDPDRRLTVGNKYVRGFAIHHYATPIACKYPDKKDPTKGTVIFNNHSYSSMTAKFQGHIRDAIPSSYTTIYVSSPRFWRGEDYVSNLRYVAKALDVMYEDQEELVKKLKTARMKSTRANLWNSIRYVQENIEKVAKFLKRKPKGLKRFKIDFEVINNLAESYFAERAEKQQARRALRDEEYKQYLAQRDADLKLTQEERIAKWRSGETCYAHMTSDDTMVRFTKNGQRVQTSRGVEILLCDALKAFKYARRIRQVGKRHPGEALGYASFVARERPQIGHYTLEEITPEGDLRIGCHFLKYEEMEQLFNQLTDEQKKGIDETIPSEA